MCIRDRDFAIYHWNGEVEYIDIKGMETQQGTMRKKMFDYKYKEKLTWIQKSIKSVSYTHLGAI